MAAIVASVSPAARAGEELVLLEASPAARGLSAAVTSSITLRFDRPVDPTTFVARQTFWAFGRWSGPADGSFVFLDGNQTVRLDPDRPFSAGESVMVLLSGSLEAADGSPFRASGHSFQFWTRAAPSGLTFSETQRFSTRTTPGEPTQSYGGVASDLNGDGHLDLGIINEDTSDLRVYLNSADGTATFEPMLTPTGVGSVPSPSEPTDFNADGNIDLAVANIAGSSVSILLGAGDGTFAPQQEVAVGGQPRGLTVLDADGDGDVDIVNTNGTSSQLSLLLNDGQGVFGAPTFFGSGTDGERAVSAGDMNHDGLLDLVVGGNTSETVQVYLADGAGGFSPQTAQASGGKVWMLVLGDLDGDGDEDVSVVNGVDDNGAILLGDGTGALAAPDIYPTDPFVLATDLGDLDGDGDLDWVTASFSGDWFLYSNNGDGSFIFEQTLDATSAASCSLAFDADGDGDLDLALIDEIADEVIILVHPGPPASIFGDDFETGDRTVWTSGGPGSR